MIFVKETRPLIVEAHPEMGALQVMQEVGKKWQDLTMDEREYFKKKADTDKVRYLTEQRAFYDEVEKIGKSVGTVTTKEGKIVVASTQPAAAPTEPLIIKKKSEEDSQLIKRKSAPPTATGENTKRLKTSESANETGVSITLAWQGSSQTGQTDVKPKKPLSAYIYFS